MKQLRILIVALVLSIGLFAQSTVGVRAAEKEFTAAELSQYDGKDGRKAYFAYKGKVYDATESTLWKLGEHFGLKAGGDLTDMMDGAPHGDEVMAKVPMIGNYQTTVDSVQTTPSAVPLSPSKSWYDAPIRIVGISVLGWTGILLGIVFVLNFATCFALPWSKVSLPWTGTRPGPDPLDASGAHLKWTAVHKYFAWATVIIGILHGILGFLQVFFKTYL